ncbi:MAG: hypothetical protein QMD61_04435 [Methanobacterium sp.]|nr:hypothetical protein [Methanobacterium sp.]
MNLDSNLELAKEIMSKFASITGLEPVNHSPKRYLWTDAFAVCNHLELFKQTNDKTYMDLALRLIGQVHHFLGQHRDDDPRTGWISGLENQEGALHPTRGGLRIGKELNERKPYEPFDERLEWERDGQYYHYLTKWMHALNRASRVTGDSTYNDWAVELAEAAHAGFVYTEEGRKRMYWKMSIDLTYPLVRSMGQHDPLDGLVTYSELQETSRDLGKSSLPRLSREITDMTMILSGQSLATNDPLSIGGLLSDASRIAQLMIRGEFRYGDLLETVVDSAILGIDFFTKNNPFELPNDYRLAFRELGMSIGLKGVEKLHGWVNESPDLFNQRTSQGVESLMNYMPLGKQIEEFWIEDKNRKSTSWIEHQEINMVMLATSIIPDGFLLI